MAEIHAMIGYLQEETNKRLANDRGDMKKKLAKNLENYKNELEAENDKRRRNENDKKDSEENLVKTLKLMTEIAELADKQNQKLLAEKQTLNIEFKSQSEDHDMILDQIVFQ